jgi:hypothetical protein
VIEIPAETFTMTKKSHLLATPLMVFVALAATRAKFPLESISIL